MDSELTPTTLLAKDTASSNITSMSKTKSAAQQSPKTESKRKPIMQAQELISRDEGEKRKLSLSQILLQMAGHLKQNSKENSSAAGEYLDWLLLALHDQNVILQDIKQQQKDHYLTEEINLLLGKYPMKLSAVKSYMKKSVKLSDPDLDLQNDPSLHLAIRQLIQHIKQHTSKNTKMAEKYKEYILSNLTRRETLLETLQDKQNSVNTEAAGKQHSGPEEEDAIPHTTDKENAEKNKTEKQQTQHTQNDDLKEAAEAKTQEIQLLKHEIEELKLKLREKEKVIESQTEKLQQTQSISPSYLRGKITTNLQDLLQFSMNADDPMKKTVNDLRSNINDLLKITEDKSMKLIRIQEDYDKQQTYIESQHEKESLEISLKNQLEILFDEQRHHLSGLIQQHSNILKDIGPPSDEISYSKKLQKPPMETLIIRRKDQTLQTQQVEKEMHDLGLDKIGIHDCRRVKGGNLQLQCRKPEDAKRIQERILSSELKDRLQVIPKRQRVIIFSIPNHVEDTELSDAIKEKIPFAIDVNLLKRIEAKGAYHQTIELDINSAQQLLNNKRLLVNFHSCPIRKYISLPRCYRCQRLGHIATVCNKRNFHQRCEFCAGEHDSRVCTLKDKENKHSCINCIRANQSDGKKFDITHAASSSRCQYYRMKLADTRSLSSRS